ncbi:hypothetical protein [Streptomyces eurythermus]|uniref:hypothetical protein n=1 Tax=Streptomyces eurythermus TaxID=42237 RepID=UPI0033D5CEBA
MASASSRRTRGLVVGGGIVVLAAAGVGVWNWAGASDSGTVCSALRGDSRIKDVLGASYRGDMSCGDLGRAFREAAAGDRPGTHSKEQAQAMRITLEAVGDALGKSGKRDVDDSLRMPLAELMADYVPDTHEILKELDADYVTHLSDGEPWEDRSGVHMTVPNEALLRVMRSVSASPSAYAVLRNAEGQYAAHTMARIPGTAKGFDLSTPVVGNALAFGALDGIASDVTARLSGQEAENWNKAVVGALSAAAPAKIPDFKADPAGYVSATWAKGLNGTTKTESDAFRSQGAEYLSIWAHGRADGFKAPGKLTEDCRNGQSRKSEEATAALKDG